MAVLPAVQDVRALQAPHLAGRCCALPCGLCRMRVAGMVRPQLLGVVCCSWQGLVMGGTREALMLSHALLKAGRFFFHF